MDAFKTGEIQRMEHGGNQPWKDFFDSHTITASEGRTFEDSTIQERYSGDVGEEWKDRLTAKVEGREYVGGEKKKKPAAAKAKMAGSNNISNNDAFRSSTPNLGSGWETEPLARSKSAAADPVLGRKEQNEAYFARMGDENLARPEHIPPSQGGKYTGFGSGFEPSASSGGSRQGENIPGLNDFQKDPMAALTKGFGWFTTTVGQGAKTVNDSYLQPAAKTVRPHAFHSFFFLFVFEGDYMLIPSYVARFLDFRIRFRLSSPRRCDGGVTKYSNRRPRGHRVV